MLLTVANLLQKKDAAGHEHASDGKFSASPGSRVPEHVRETPHERHAIFMVGGAASGKTAYVRGYVGNHGDTDKDGVTIAPGHKDYVPAMPGFDRRRSYDADGVKAILPTYKPVTDRDGLYGASGPKSVAELKKYPVGVAMALQKFIQTKTPFTSIRDFAQKRLGGDGKSYGKGITHELSQYVSKQAAIAASRDPHGRSFVYDSTGGNSHLEMARDALKSGYRVTFHHVSVPPSVAQMRNAGRERKLPKSVVAESHARIASVLPNIRDFIARHAARGHAAHYVTSHNASAEDVAQAQKLGFK